MDFLREIGALAGLAAFLGLAVLALLYFSQARDLRRLRENASFLVEGSDGQEGPGTQAPAPAAREKAAVAAPPANASQQEIEAFRRAELARQASERRERFERRRGGGRGLRRAGGGQFGSLGPTALAVILVGVLLLLGGVGFAASRLLGADDDGGGSASRIEQEVSVKVLNSTAETGLAGQFARQLKQRGFDASSFNTSIPLEVSEVMYDGRSQQEAATEVARALKIERVGPLQDEFRPDAAGAPVVVVLGEDKAQGA